MRAFPIALMAAATLALTQPAAAAIVVGTFSGTVTQGEARGNFGFDTPTNLAGKHITGTFRYDTALLGPDCSAASFFGCFLGTGMSITQTINGAEEVFTGSSLAPDPNLQLNTGNSGLLLYDLVGDAVNLHTLSMIGTPGTVYNERETALAFGLASGGIGDTSNPVLTYDGTANGAVYEYLLSGQRFDVNRSRIFQLTAGFFTQQTTYDFTVDRVTFGVAVPEPGTWVLMILGFGTVGTMLRRRRPTLA
jgi:hypothetical protein